MEDASEIVSYLSETVSEEMSLAFAYLDEVLFARIYDGERYVFPLPFMLSEEADAEEALLCLASYSRRELIPLIITDVPLEGITLDEICDADKDKYAELCRDRSLNRYWGYDVYADNPGGEESFYLNVARREIEDGVAIALAIREGGQFVGEATLYDFNYRGSASIAVRVLPDYHSKGIGSRATMALIELARNIGLTAVNAEILNENERSIKMAAKFMQIVNRTESKTLFTLSL